MWLLTAASRKKALSAGLLATVFRVGCLCASNQRNRLLLLRYVDRFSERSSSDGKPTD